MDRPPRAVLVTQALDAPRGAGPTDPSTLAVLQKIDVGGRAEGVAVAPDGSIWVTISALGAP